MFGRPLWHVRTDLGLLEGIHDRIPGDDLYRFPIDQLRGSNNALSANDATKCVESNTI